LENGFLKGGFGIAINGRFGQLNGIGKDSNSFGASSQSNVLLAVQPHTNSPLQRQEQPNGSGDRASRSDADCCLLLLPSMESQKFKTDDSLSDMILLQI